MLIPKPPRMELLEPQLALGLDQTKEQYALTAWWAKYRGQKDGEDCECPNCVDRRARYSPRKAS